MKFKTDLLSYSCQNRTFIDWLKAYRLESQCDYWLFEMKLHQMLWELKKDKSWIIVVFCIQPKRIE